MSSQYEPRVVRVMTAEAMVVGFLIALVAGFLVGAAVGLLTAAWQLGLFFGVGMFALSMDVLFRGH